MITKIYFWGMFLVAIFVNYYQFFIIQSYNLPGILFLIRDITLILGGYAYFFKKKVFSPKQWKYILYFLLIHLFITFLLQIAPQSYLGDFSILNANLLTNIFAFLLVNSFFIPLYLSVYKLNKIPKSTGKSKKTRKKS